MSSPRHRLDCSLIGPAASPPASARVADEAPASITTPEQVSTRIGELESPDGATTHASAKAVPDHLDFTDALRASGDTATDVCPPDSAWSNDLFVTGSQFEPPIPEVAEEGVTPDPPSGHRTMDARTIVFYGVTGVTPAMPMHLTGIGSQYLLASKDARSNDFDGTKTCKVTLPEGIPEANLRPLTVYDTTTRSTLDSPRREPAARAIRLPQPGRMPTARRPTPSPPSSPRASAEATGSRRSPARAGS